MSYWPPPSKLGVGWAQYNGSQLLEDLEALPVTVDTDAHTVTINSNLQVASNIKSVSVRASSNLTADGTVHLFNSQVTYVVGASNMLKAYPPTNALGTSEFLFDLTSQYWMTQYASNSIMTLSNAISNVDHTAVWASNHALDGSNSSTNAVVAGIYKDPTLPDNGGDNDDTIAWTKLTGVPFGMNKATNEVALLNDTYAACNTVLYRHPTRV